jgi:hypothetical protein
MKKSYSYLTDRVQTRLNDNLDMRKDGVFRTFNVFWKTPLGNTEWIKDENNWTWASEVTEYSPYGFELENRDALNRYSGAIYGFGNILPKAVANNSRYSDIGADDFEDYGYNADCQNDHFSFRKDHAGKVVDTESHTGKQSIKVSAGSSVTVNKVIQGCK